MTFNLNENFIANFEDVAAQIEQPATNIDLVEQVLMTQLYEPYDSQSQYTPTLLDGCVEEAFKLFKDRTFDYDECVQFVASLPLMAEHLQDMRMARGKAIHLIPSSYGEWHPFLWLFGSLSSDSDADQTLPYDAERIALAMAARSQYLIFARNWADEVRQPSLPSASLNNGTLETKKVLAPYFLSSSVILHELSGQLVIEACNVCQPEETGGGIKITFREIVKRGKAQIRATLEWDCPFSHEAWRPSALFLLFIARALTGVKFINQDEDSEDGKLSVEFYGISPDVEPFKLTL